MGCSSIEAGPCDAVGNPWISVDVLVYRLVQ